MGERFDWNYPGLNKTHFNALGNLLSLRNGGQVEPAWLPDEMLEEVPEEDDDWDTASVDTRNAHQISDSGHNRLKRKFLDCLAEFASNRKNGKTVACTAMKEAEDNVTLWIARNEGFPDHEKPLFRNLSDLLSRLSCNKENKTIKDLLWNEMLSYHQDRIQSNYIPSLRANFKHYSTTDNNSSIGNQDDELSVLRKLAFEVTKPGQTTIDKHDKLVTTAYELRVTRSVEDALQSSPGATTKTRKLWADICLLARLRVAFQKFEEIALRLPSFNKVTIALLPRHSASVNPPISPLSLKQAFDILKLKLDSPTVKSMIGQKWAVNKAEQEFAKRQKQRLNIHAEVQMLLFLSSNEPSFHELLPYFGCSKLSCFMCAHFLQSHGKFATRGCHGRLFKPWTLPETAGLGLGRADKIAMAVMQLQKDLKKELKSAVKTIKHQEKTSVIGGSSILSGYKAEGSRRQSELERRRLKAEQERVAEMFKRQSLERNRVGSKVEATTDSSEDAHAISETDEFDQCYSCYNMTSRKCSICGKGLFCSELCQEKRSGSHLFTCTKRPLTSADYLYRCIGDDVLPEDEDVLEDFGFNQLTSFADKCKLLGLYKGLYLSEIAEEDVHKWQVEGTLVENIKEFFYQIPETHRGGYFPWFLKNTHILERRVTGKESTENMVMTFYDQARSYLDSEDQHNYQNLKELKPEAKAHCYHMLAGVLHMAHPHPIEYNWYAFGFCTCHGERSENSLGGLYQQLLVGEKLFEDVNHMANWHPPHKAQTATFTEFWQSYQSGTLIQLMDSKGLKQSRSCFPFLEEFLSVPPSGPQPSVWDLKQFIAINDPAEYPPIPALKVDYGFMNCRDFEETCILMEIYKRLLQDADPLELHKACLAGKLFVFAQKFHAMDEGHKRLMENFYPL